MSTESDPDPNKRNGPTEPNRPHPSVGNSGEHHQLSAHKGYETAKHLAKKLRQTAGRLSFAEWSTVFFTAIIAIATVVNVCIVSGQLNEMRGEQRPIVWVGKNLGTPKLIISPTGGGQVFWTFHFSNYGKGFVARGHLKTFLKIGDRPFEPSFGQTENGNAVAPIAPGQDSFASPVSRPGITETKFKQLVGRDKSFEMKARFDYVDSSGNAYETGICLFYFATGAIGFCPGAENNYVR